MLAHSEIVLIRPLYLQLYQRLATVVPSLNKENLKDSTGDWVNTCNQEWPPESKRRLVPRKTLVKRTLQTGLETGISTLPPTQSKLGRIRPKRMMLAVVAQKIGGKTSGQHELSEREKSPDIDTEREKSPRAVPQIAIRHTLPEEAPIAGAPSEDIHTTKVL
eukprot:Em0024g153a